MRGIGSVRGNFSLHKPKKSVQLPVGQSSYRGQGNSSFLHGRAHSVASNREMGNKSAMSVGSARPLGGYSQHKYTMSAMHNQSMYEQNSSALSGGREINSNYSPGKGKRAKTYHSLAGKTIAEENLKGFSMKAARKVQEMPLGVSLPQRIELPVYFNTPRRKDDYMNYKKYRSKTPDGEAKGYINNTSALNMSYTDSYNRISASKRIKDYQMLAFACKRANKLRDEGRAYYSSGVLYDNLGKHAPAVAQYQRFLSVCKKIGDSHGEALAYNCIGVAYQKLAHKEPKFYKDSIEYHLKHKNIADIGGKFIAHVNLGIVYDEVGEKEKAAVNQQFALRYAIQMSSAAGQSIAVGNLGKIGSNNTVVNNPQKLQLFVERYLQLSQELNNKKGTGSAYLQLGKILSEKGDIENSLQHFERAMEVAHESGDKDIKKEACVNCGIMNGQLNWDDHVQGILTSIQENYAAE